MTIGCHLRAVASLLLAFLLACPAHARMALLVGEPFGTFGWMMPQGHASIYLQDACVETAIRLRPCGPGETGAVVSRYHDLRHPAMDWMAFPLPVFLYGGDDFEHLPSPYLTAAGEADLRERYRAKNLAAFVPAGTGRRGDPLPPPTGDWAEGIGSAFDRRLYVYSFDTTPEQDQAALRWLNDRANRRSYTLTRHNCADFAADLLRIVLPAKVIHRNVLADFDMTTPKQLAREVDTYGQAHPELHLRVDQVPQWPGSLRRSRPVRGAAESLITNRLYFSVVLAVQPELMLTDWIVYEKRGKWRLGADALTTDPLTWRAEAQPPAQPPIAPATPGR